MDALAGRRIVLGVCGSIAAYKAVLVLRGLQQQGAEVRPVLTAAARRFVQPLTFETLARQPVYDDLWDTGGNWTAHVELAEWAELLLVAPATAQTLAKFAAGFCDNLLTAVYLSARRPVILAPAMDLEMYRHPALRRNLDRLAADGCQIIEPESGFLSSGLQGQGRLPEPETIVARVIEHFQQESRTSAPQLLSGKKVLITAGPTREALDPVRYLSNHSTGKMGIALAAAARQAGAAVTLLLGPTELNPPSGVETLRFTSAAELQSLMLTHWPLSDLLVMTAAVADYTPAAPADRKIKKAGETLTLELRQTPDLLAEAARSRRPQQKVVGFALETDDEEAHALDKLRRKGLDAIVLNSLQDAGAGFGHDTNRVSVFDRTGRRADFPLMNKTELAQKLIQHLAAL